MPKPPLSPEPPRPNRSAPSAGSANAGTWIALFGLLLAAGALVGLMALVMPQFLGLVAVVGALFVVPIALHYVVWGWRISRWKENHTEDE